MERNKYYIIMRCESKRKIPQNTDLQKTFLTKYIKSTYTTSTCTTNTQICPWVLLAGGNRIPSGYRNLSSWVTCTQNRIKECHAKISPNKLRQKFAPVELSRLKTFCSADAEALRGAALPKLFKFWPS